MLEDIPQGCTMIFAGDLGLTCLRVGAGNLNRITRTDASRLLSY